MFGKEPEPQPSMFGTQASSNTAGFGQGQTLTSNLAPSSVFGTPSTSQASNQHLFGSAQPQSQSGFGVSQPVAPQQSVNLFSANQPQSEPQPSSFGSNQVQAKPASSSFSFNPPQNHPGFGTVGGFGNPGPACFGTPAPANPFCFYPNPPSVRRYTISPYNPTRKLRNYSYYITIESAEYKADAHIIINSQDHFKLSSALLSQNCEFFARELKSKSELSLDLPTQSFVYEFFLYLNYRYTPDLLDKTTSFQDILDLYILLHKFEYKYAETLLDSAFSKIPTSQQNPLHSYYPKELHRDYIPFDFCIRLARNFSHCSGIFGIPSDYSASLIILAYLLIWLGFDAIKSRQELSDLLDSEDCQKVKEYIELYELYPTDQNQLNNILSRFPEAVFILNHDKLLKKLRVV